MDKELEKFAPADAHRIKVMHHKWKADVDLTVDALLDYGFGGVVTNVPEENGFVQNTENIAKFKEITERLKERNFPFWIYDENGYPSGQAGGETLKRNPDFVAKGLYMRKFEAFLEPMNFIYRIDGVSQKIAYAVKYKQDLSDVCEARILFDTATPLVYCEEEATVGLLPGEIAYVFVVKIAYEGSHSVHNVSSRKKYINLLNKEAVRAYIDVCYAPLTRTAPDAFSAAEKVFTDEPSLMTAYARSHERFNYALLPYDEGLFERFQAKYGYDMQKYLPLLFEETDALYKKLRVDFYNFIGETIAENYVGQIADFVGAHGSEFSGHYLGEENLYEHVATYGNYVSVLMRTGYPGMDILQCTPLHRFFFNAPKFLQMIARKKNTDGFMVEYCPFFDKEIYFQDPVNYYYGTLSLLAMSGARKVNTYSIPRLSEYDERLFVYDEGLSREEYKGINDYFARLVGLLTGRKVLFDTYVYYALEDVQAKFTPRISGNFWRDRYLASADDSDWEIADILLRHGDDYGFLDKDDLVAGAVAAKRIIVPKIDFMYEDSIVALKKAQKNGTDVVFMETRPEILETGEKISFGRLCTYRQLAEEERLRDISENVFVANYEGGRKVVYNNSQETKKVALSDAARVYVPETGDIVRLTDGTFEIPPLRAVVFEAGESVDINDKNVL